MRELKEYNIDVVIYEPTLNVALFENYPLQNDLDNFLRSSDVILANRMHEDLDAVKSKVYTRDLFGKN